LIFEVLTTQEAAVTAAPFVYGTPQAIRMDNGPKMASDTFTEWAKENGITLLFIQPVIHPINQRLQK